LDVLRREVPATSLVIAIDPGKALNRVVDDRRAWAYGEPVSLPVLRDGVDELERLIAQSDVGSLVIGLEETGALHRTWSMEIERRWPGSLRLVAPSETTAARAQLGSRRFKTDDRDCAATISCSGRVRAGRQSRRGRVAAGDGASSPPARRRSQEAAAATA